MTGDRDLLRALFVQHLGFAPAPVIIAAGAEWLVRRGAGASLGDVLKERGVLDGPRAELVEAMVDEAIKLHGTAEETLRTLPPEMQSSLQGLHATLGGAAASKRTGAGEHATPDTAMSFDSLETPENVGTEARGRYSFDTGPNGSLEELGHGGVGSVVVARDHFLDRDVAMKELKRDITTSEKYDTMQVHLLESRFLREARVTGQLVHPAIVPVYELGRRRDGTLYFTMQRVRGRTLATAMSDARTLEGRLAFVPDLLTACRAVAAAHQRAVIHRDLKPQNVMLGAHGETYVMDWGLARVLGRREPEQQRPPQLAPDLTGGRDVGPVGTPSYMAPEQAWGRHEDIDERSDVWGLGAMLFELLAGRPPYIGRSPWDVLADVRSTAAPKVRSLVPDAPAELAAICDKALARERADRYRNAGALAADLEAWLAGQRVSAYEYSLREVLRRLVTQHRGVVLLLVAVLIAFGALGTAAVVSISRERDEAREMARFYLVEVAPTLANAPGAADVLDQLSHSALETFAAGVDLERGPKEDRLLLAHAWNEVGHSHWKLGRGDASVKALASGARVLGPLARAFPEDPHVAIEGIENETWSCDLLIDEGRIDDALARLEAQLAAADRLVARAPELAAAHRAQALVLGRITVVRSIRGEHEVVIELARRAVAADERCVRLSSDDVGAVNELVITLGRLVEAEEAGGARDRAVAAAERAVVVARELRSKSDTRASRESLARTLFGLGRMLVGEDARRANDALLETRKLFEGLRAGGPISNSAQMFDSEAAILLGQADEAWAVAERLAASKAGGEFEAAVVEAAFAAGKDEVLLERLAKLPDNARAAGLFYGSLAHARSGNLAEAKRLAAQCSAERCLSAVFWLPGIVELRPVKGRGAAAVAALAPVLRRAGTPPADIERAWGEYVALLGNGGSR